MKSDVFLNRLAKAILVQEKLISPRSLGFQSILFERNSTAVEINSAISSHERKKKYEK